MADNDEGPAPGLITDEDERWLIGGCDFITAGAEGLQIRPSSLRWALESTAPRLRARWVAEALDALAGEMQRQAVGQRGNYPEAAADRDAWRNAAELTEDRAAEYRDGKR